MYRSLARWCYERRWLVVGLWLLAMVGINAAGGAIGTAFDSSFSTPDSESTSGFDTVEEYFPGAGSQFGGSIVFQTDAGVDDPAVMEAMMGVNGRPVHG